MKISTKLLYSYIREQYPVLRFGRSFHSEELPLPVFWRHAEEIKPGGFYIARTQDLPLVSHTDCLFLCAGNRPTHIGSSWRGSVLFIAQHELDIFTLFNVVIGFFDKITKWDCRMRELLDSNAPIASFVQSSLPVFENCITITDYNLRILVNCDIAEASNGQRKIVISDALERIPDKIIQSFTNAYRHNIHLREPFTSKGQAENPEGDNYCINIHLGSTYLGTCSLWNKLRPMRESDFLLFQRFAEYIRRMLSAQSRTLPNQFITMKNIFSDLLQSFPVSNADLQGAMDLLQKNMEFQDVRFGCWHCLVIFSSNRDKTLPEEYLCASLENLLPHSTAMIYEEQIVCFCMLPEGDNFEDTVCELLHPYLRDMNFRTGVSAPFQDLFKARDYYLQAKALSEIGYELSPNHLIYCFEDYILPYMLQHCSGMFEPDMVFSPGFEKLRALDNGVDYLDTLKRYLDHECNASKTAQELYLHRSSLLPRLEKIKTLVDLETPNQRLYLRMCIALLDILETEKKNR